MDRMLHGAIDKLLQNSTFETAWIFFIDEDGSTGWWLKPICPMHSVKKTAAT
jgi:hypothetical protein